MLRPCRVKRSSRVGRVVTCRKCWVYGAEKGIIKVKCPGKPVPGNCAKRAWWRRQREEWPRNVACLLSAWGVAAHQADDVCKYRHSRVFEAALVRFGELAGRLQGCLCFPVGWYCLMRWLVVFGGCFAWGRRFLELFFWFGGPCVSRKVALDELVVWA